jgi:PPM family protein phosphatase
MKTKIAVHWHYAVATHTGWFRTTNEDRSLLRMGTTKAGMPYAAAALADGMGGSGEGNQASETAIGAVKQWLDERLPILLEDKAPMERVKTSLQGLFKVIHRILIEKGEESGTMLGTTLTLLFLMNEEYLVVHVGDCRVYCLPRRGSLRRLTRDHSWVSEQVRRGRMTRKQARNHPRRHVLLQALGVKKEPNIYVREGLYVPRSLFYICSDGFHDRFSDLRLAEMLQHARDTDRDLQELSDELLDLALDRHADDNISLLLLRPMTRTRTDKERYLLRAANGYRWVKKLPKLVSNLLRK